MRAWALPPLHGAGLSDVVPSGSRDRLDDTRFTS
jgi:hypothetical protein